jgi:hypothetical protein
VLAYLNTYNQDPGYGTGFLSEFAQHQHRQGTGLWELFRPGTRDVCIKQISYGPGAETESEVQSFGTANDQTTTDIEAREQSNTPLPQGTSLIEAVVTTTATYKPRDTNDPQTIEIRWKLIREPRPAGEQEMWRIDSIQ